MPSYKKSIRFCEYYLKANIYGITYNIQGFLNVNYKYDKEEDSLDIVCRIEFKRGRLLLSNFGEFISKHILPKNICHPSDIFSSPNGFDIYFFNIKSLDDFLNMLYKFYSENKCIMVKKPYEMVISVKIVKKPRDIISQIVLDIL